MNFKYGIKHERLCCTSFQNSDKRVENMTRSEVFLTNFDMSGNVVKHSLEKRRSKIEKSMQLRVAISFV